MFGLTHETIKQQLEKLGIIDTESDQIKDNLIINAVNSAEKTIGAMTELKEGIKGKKTLNINSLLLIATECELIYNEIQCIKHEHHLTQSK